MKSRGCVDITGTVGRMSCSSARQPHRAAMGTISYRVSPIRPTRKIRPSVIFEDDFNVSPTRKISPS